MRRQSCWAVGLFTRTGVQAVVAILLLLAGSAMAAEGSGVKPTSPTVDKTSVAKKLSLLPLSFEANQGQADPRAKFLSRGPGYTMFLTGQDTVLSLQSGKHADALRLRWIGSKHSAALEGVEPLSLKSNYFIGSDPRKWRTNVPNYGRVLYKSLYDGIDLAFYGSGGRLENDFVIAPGADPATILLGIDGASKLQIEADGTLSIKTTSGAVRLLKPVAYQATADGRREVVTNYELVAGNRVRLKVGAYDHSQPLVIDPVIDYMTYISTVTSTSLTVNAAAVDSSNNVFVTGYTTTTTFPSITATTPTGATSTFANKDIFILKLDNNGAASVVVFLGGSGDDIANGIAIGSTNNVYITGQTTSSNFPVTSPTFQSAPAGSCNNGTHICTTNSSFVTKISNAGSQVLYSTYIGGSGDDIANAIAVSTPHAYITGSTTSSSSGTAFPTHNAAFSDISKAGNTDGFVAVLTANTESIPSTAASCGTFTTTCAPITCTAKVATINFASATSFKTGDRVTISGVPNGPNKGNIFNGTVTLTGASGTQATYALTACNGTNAPDWSSGGIVVGLEQYGSYFGANSGATGNTAGNAIAIDGSGFADITGSNTASFNSTGGVAQTASGGGTDAIVTQFDPTQSGAGSQNFATFLGGAGTDVGKAIVVDASNNIYVGGSTTSTETTSKLCNSGGAAPFANTCSLQTSNGGGTDGFIVKLNSTGTTIAFSTYLGGAGTDSINRLRWDGTNLYAAGATASTGFLGGTVIGSLGGTQDGFVANINPATPVINYGVYVGGNGNNDAITGFVLDPTITTAWYAVGNTDSNNLTTTGSSYQPQPAQTISAGTPVAGFAVHYDVITANTTTLTVTANAATVNNSSTAPGLVSPNLIWYDSNSANSDITFPFIVTNSGVTNSASDIVFNLVIPNISNAPPLNITSAAPNGGTGTCATAVNTATYSSVTCKVSALATSAAQEFDVRTTATSTAAANTGSTVTLTASAAAANANNTTGAATGLNIVSVAKLTVANTATIPNNSSQNTAVNGFGPFHDGIFRLDFDTAIEWDFSVSNAGPGAAPDAQFTLVLPTGTLAANVSETNSACATALTATTVNTMPAVTCTLKPIAASGSLTVKILMNPPAVPAALATAGTGTWVDPNNNALGVSVITSAGGYADDGSTNATTYGGTVRREASVAVTVTPASQTGIHAGDAINPGGTPAGYSVQVSNAGPSQATNVLLGFTLDTTGTAPQAGGALTGIRVTSAGSGYTSAPAVNITGGGGSNASATATISAVISNTINITNAGTGYTNPVVTISGGGGTGAVATATQAGGAINNITVTNQGSGYAFPPTVTITDGGYGAAATATISGGVVTGFTILNGGSGYVTPLVTLVGGDGTGATATAVVTGGVITAINVGVAGTGYNTTAPTVIITETGGGPGTGATATASLVNGTVTFVTLNNAGTGYSSAPTVTAGTGAATFAAGGNFAGSNFTSVAFTGTGCAANGSQQVNCTVTTPLVPGVPYNISVTANAPATIHPSAGTQSFDSSNAATTALVSSTTTIGAGGLTFGSAATFSTLVQRQSDLAVASFYDNSPVNLSGVLSYTTAVQNNPTAQANNDDAEGVLVTYTFPNGSVLQTTTPNTPGYVTDDYGSGECTVPTAAKNTYVCTVGHLENNGSRVFHIKVVPNSAWVNCGNSSCTINASTAISGNVVDGTSANNSATITSTIQRIADLAITTNADNSPSSIAGPLKLYVTVHNNGPDDATATGGITLTFTLPTGFVWNSAYAGTFAGGATGLTGSACTGTTTLTCTVNAGLTAGATATFALPLTPATSGANSVPSNATSITLGTTAGTTSPTVAVAGANVIDNTAGNNGPVSYSSVIQRTADISVGLGATADNSPVPISGTLKLYAKVQNFGPDDVTSPVTVTFALPTGFVYNSSFAGSFAGGSAFPNGVCSGTTTVTCTLAGLTVASGAVTYGLPVIPATTGANSVPSTSTSITLGTTGGTTSPTVAIASSNIAQNTDAGDGSYSSSSSLHSDGPASYSSVIQRTSNLQVTLPATATNSPSSLSGPLKLYATVKNNGPDDIAASTNGITVTFTLPTGFTYNSAFAGTFATGTGLTGTACTGTTTVICSFSGGLTSGTSTIYALPVTPATTGANSVPASATSITLGTTGGTTAPKVDVNSNGTPNYVNAIATGADGQFNTAASSNLLQTYSGVVIQRTSDVTVTLPGTPDNSPVAISGTLQLFATVQNAGPDDVPSTGTATSALTVTFTLPTGFAYNSSFNSFGGGVTGLTGSACTGTTTVTCKFTSGITVASGATTYALPVTPATSGANSVPTTAASITLGTSAGTTHPLVAVALGNASDSKKGADDSYNVAETVNTQAYSSTVQRQSNLQITTASSTNGAKVSITGPWTIAATMTNAGPDQGESVKVTYKLPSNGYRLSTNTPPTGYAGGACTQPAQGNAGDDTITCVVGSLAKSALLPTTVSISPDPNAVPTNASITAVPVTTTPEVVSTAVVDDGPAGGPNTTTGNNDFPVSINIERQSDLQVQPLTDNSPAALKGPLTITSPISTTGDDAVGVVVTYTLPNANYLFNGTTTGYPSNVCTQAGGSNQVVCNFGNLTAASGANSVSIQVTPDPAVITANNNSATTGTITAAIASTAVADSTPGNNSKTISSTIQRKSDLAVTTLTDNSPISEAGPLTFTSIVQNSGPDDATSVHVKFTLPNASYTIGSNDFGPGVCTQAGGSNIIDCAIGSLTVAAGAVTNHMSVAPDPAAVGTGVAVATPAPSTTIAISSIEVVDGTSSNDNKSINSTIQRQSDLKISGTPTATSPVAISGTITLATVAQNAGPDTANNVKVTYTFTSGSNYQIGSPNIGTCAKAGLVITCSLPDLTNGSTASLSLPITPDPAWVASNAASAPVPIAVQAVSNTVIDKGTNGAPDANNNAALNPTVQRQSDLKMVAASDNSPVGEALGPLTFTAQIQNAGTDDATNVVIVYTLPDANYIFQSQVGFIGNPACTQVANVITCSVGTLTPGPTPTYQLTVKPNPNAVPNGSSQSQVSTSIQVTSTSVIDGAAGNNSSAVLSTLQRLSTLSMTHTSNPVAGSNNPANFAQLGTQVAYTIVVNNANSAGNSPATGIQVDEVFPASFTPTGVDTVNSDSAWGCTVATHTVCSYNAAIAVGGKATLVLLGSYADDPTLALPGGGSFPVGTGNSGNVSATLSSTATVDNSLPFTLNTSTDLKRVVALSATATSNPPAGTSTFANLGTPVVYTISVSNAASAGGNATNQAAGAFVDIALPSNLSGVAINTGTSSPGWSCNPANFSTSPVRCTQTNAIAAGTPSVLVLTGSYLDDPTKTILTGGIGTGAITVTPGTTQSLQVGSFVPQSVSTDIRRWVHLTATHTSNPPAGTFVNLGGNVSYTIQVSNAASANSLGTNTAAGIVVKEHLPTNFINPASNSNNWTCTFTSSPAVCTYSGTIASGTTAVDPLVITGQFSDDPNLTNLPGGSGYAVGTGNRAVTADLTATTSLDATPSSVATSTDLRRNVQLTISQGSPSVDPVSLGTNLTYTLQASNALSFNTATDVTITDTLPSGFNFTSVSGSGWSCAPPSGGQLTCATSSIAAGATSSFLVISGSYDPNTNLAGSGQATRSNIAAVGSASSFDNGTANKSASVNSTIQRASDLSVAVAATPNPIGAGGAATNLVTYTVTVSNNGNDVTGPNDSSAVKVDFPVPLPGSFKNITASGTGSSPVSCDTTGTPGHVICTYAVQTTLTPTVITIKGQFDQSAVLQNGSATASTTVNVGTTDAVDSVSSNNSATTNVIVVDTPAGSNISPILSSTGHPVTVTYPTVTRAGITTQVVTQVPPIGFHEPAVDYPTVDYSAPLSNYFLIASDSTAPVNYTTPVSICVAYKTLTGITFTKPERLRIFDSNGRDITASLDANNVCGLSTNVSPGAFTVREPRNHAPVAKAATQQLFAGKIGTNQFTMDASGSTDADIQQVCNGTNAVCGDTLTYVWTGPPGMNGGTGGNSFTQTVAPKADGTLGSPAQVTGSFPLGVSTVTLTVTDQTGASSTSQVSVTVNSFTLSTTNQSAVISAGQSTSFQVVPQDTNAQPLQFTGNMTLTCAGKKDADGSTLAANHVACVVSPNPIAQGQFATALLTTTGPNFSQVRPVKPGSGNRSLALVFALMSPALMGIVLVPGRNKRWKALLLLVLLVACLGLQLGCGGSGVAPAVQSQPAQTPSGTYTVTITGTAAGGIASTNTFTLTVR